MSAARLAAIEAGRQALGLSIERLAASAELSARHYFRLIDGYPASAEIVARLAYALRRRGMALSNGEAVGFAYDAALALVCAKLSLDPVAVKSFDPQRGATANSEWRRASHARQLAIYLVNTSGGVKQKALAQALDLTPAAICLALQSVGDRFGDDHDTTLARVFDELNREITEAPPGGMRA